MTDLAPPRPDPQPRAAWYADPGDPSMIRYWDGRAWSPHSRPRPPEWDKLSAAAPLPWWQRWWAVATALVLFAPLGLPGLWRRPGLSTRLRLGVSAVALVFFGAVVLSGGDEAPTEAAAPPASAAPSSSSEPDTTVDDEPAVDEEPDVDEKAVEPKPPKPTVPRVVGMSGRQAERQLAAVGLVGFVAREVPSPRRSGTVLRQLRAVGASVREGSSVGLVVAVPYPAVPGTAGMTETAATQRLRDAGFRVDVVREVVTSGRDGVVLRQTPVGSQLARPNSVVTLVVANVVRPVAPPAPSSCTAGYRPCLPPASDYDCEGGSGDGPRYTGLVYVTGFDPYDLDADGDGIACES